MGKPWSGGAFLMVFWAFLGAPRAGAAESLCKQALDRDIRHSAMETLKIFRLERSRRTKVDQSAFYNVAYPDSARHYQEDGRKAALQVTAIAQNPKDFPFRLFIGQREVRALFCINERSSADIERVFGSYRQSCYYKIDGVLLTQPQPVNVAFAASRKTVGIAEWPWALARKVGYLAQPPGPKSGKDISRDALKFLIMDSFCVEKFPF